MGAVAYLKANRKSILIYTVIFCAVSLLLVTIFGVYHYHLLQRPDGRAQHYTALASYGQWLRDLIHSWFVEHKFSFPEWDFSFGFGANIITTLHYYCIGDPLSLLAVFFSGESVEVLYVFLLFFRLYLAGLAFHFFCFYMNRTGRAVLAGSLIYILNGYVMFVVFRQPFFMAPMIWLPLLLIGVERIFRGKSPVFFIFMVFIAAVSNFYFLYVLTLALILYVGFRFFSLGKKSVKEFFQYVGRFLLYGIIGVAMSAALLVPVIFAMLDGTGARGVFSGGGSLLYSGKYYLDLIKSLLSSDIIGSERLYTNIGLPALAFLAVLLLFAKKGKPYKQLKIAVLMAVVFLLFPIFGCIFNGLSYACNRWLFIIMFFIGYILTMVWEDITHPDAAQKRIMLLGTVIYTGVILLLYVMNLDVSANGFTGVIFTWAFLAVILLFQEEGSGSRIFKRGCSTVLIVLLIVNIFVNWNYRYDLNKDSYMNRFDQSAEWTNKLQTSAAVLASSDEVDTEQFSRYEADDSGDISALNASSIFGVNGTQFYWSIANGDVSAFLNDMDVNIYSGYRYSGLDQRTFLMEAAGVRYYVKKRAKSALPCGYKKIDEVDMGDEVHFDIYENKYALPLGYTSDHYITQEQYEGYSDLQKQQAILQGIVIGEDDASIKEKYKKAEPLFNDTKMDYTVTPSNKVIMLDDNHILVTEKGGSIELGFANVKGNEVYLQFQGLKAEYMTPYEILQEREKLGEDTGLSEMSLGERYDQKRQALDYDPMDFEQLKIKVTCGSRSKEFMYHPENAHDYTGQTDYLANFGYIKRTTTSMKITFPKEGIYSFESMNVVCQPMDRYKKMCSALMKDVLKKIEIGEDQITGTISLDSDKILCLTIPYDKGWKLYVDGKETEILHANTMFMGVPLEAGKHSILLEYHTSKLKPGILISLVGVVAFAVIIIVYHRKKKHGTEQ